LKTSSESFLILRLELPRDVISSMIIDLTRVRIEGRFCSFESLLNTATDETKALMRVSLYLVGCPFMIGVTSSLISMSS